MDVSIFIANNSIKILLFHIRKRYVLCWIYGGKWNIKKKNFLSYYPYGNVVFVSLANYIGYENGFPTPSAIQHLVH